ncbi:MAG TPA: carboxypeptidase-like regulatory domain-containing protein [Candidatus Limnocylindria bacterium]|nr:carboxypeptidase-like regulatory domain-containing protein [Candidatus Limnocylindria bacterium]
MDTRRFLLLSFLIAAVARGADIEPVPLRAFAGGTSVERVAPARLIPQGRQVYGGVPFLVDGAIQLFGEGPQEMKETNRLTVTGIPVNRAFARLHLLGGSAFETTRGEPVAWVRLHYADGTTNDLPVIQGAHVLSFWGLRHQPDPAFSDPATRVVWRAAHALASDVDKQLRVLRTELVNPRPEQPVATLDLISAKSRASLIVLALSTGPASASPLPDTVTVPAYLLPRTPSNPARTADLTGRVLTTNGLPVAEATVQVVAAVPINQPGVGEWTDHPSVGTSTRTAADGGFTLTGLPDDVGYRLRAHKPGFAVAAWPSADPRGGPIEFRLRPYEQKAAPTNRLARGRLVSPAGQPVAGAVVKVSGTRKNGSMCFGCTEGFEPEVVTEADGEFSLTNPEAFEFVELEVQAGGFAPIQHWPLKSGGELETRALTSGGEVTGTVLKDGQPLGGVRVRISGQQRNTEIFLGDYSTLTDREGRFRLGHLPLGAYVLAGDLESFAPQGALSPRPVIFKKESETIALTNLVVQPGLTLAGRVTVPAGTASPRGLRLSLSFDDSGGASHATVGDDGRFSFTNVFSGPARLSVQGNGFRLSPHNRSLDPWNPSTLQGLLERDKLNFELALLPGEYQWRNGPADSGQLPPSENPLQRPLRGIEDNHERIQSVSGSVVDDDTGRPVKLFSIIPGAQPPIAARPANPNPVKAVIEAFRPPPLAWNERPCWFRQREEQFADGAFRMDYDLIVSSPLIIASADGYEPFVSGPLPGGTNGLVVRLKPARPNGGVVLQPDGKPAAGAIVVLAAEGSQVTLLTTGGLGDSYGDDQRVVCDSAGRFALKPLLKASRLFIAHTNGFLGLPANRLGPNLTLKLEPWATLTGVLVGPDGAPVPGEDLTLTQPGYGRPDAAFLNFYPWPRTDAQGRFTFARVPADDFQLVRLQPMGTGGWSHQPQRPVTLRAGETNQLGNVLKDSPPKAPAPGTLETLKRELGL